MGQPGPNLPLASGSLGFDSPANLPDLKDLMFETAHSSLVRAALADAIEGGATQDLTGASAAGDLPWIGELIRYVGDYELLEMLGHGAWGSSTRRASEA